MAWDFADIGGGINSLISGITGNGDDTPPKTGSDVPAREVTSVNQAPQPQVTPAPALSSDTQKYLMIGGMGLFGVVALLLILKK